MRSELSKVGAGVIGNYSHCSFGQIGEGTFVGNEKSNPGMKGRGRRGEGGERGEREGREEGGGRGEGGERGDIGNYSHCSFGQIGEGTFVGNEKSNPGMEGRREKGERRGERGERRGRERGERGERGEGEGRHRELQPLLVRTNGRGHIRWKREVKSWYEGQERGERGGEGRERRGERGESEERGDRKEVSINSNK